MITLSKPATSATNLALDHILNQPEPAVLRRLTKMVECLFRVPVAYMALLDHKWDVANRIGSGREHWEFLRTYPLTDLVGAPAVIKDVAKGLPPGVDFGDIRFAASAPLRTSGGLELGVLVIAGLQPRPDFSEQDLQALAALAEVLAGKMELRLVASQAIELERALRETEARFRAIANTAPVPIFYAGPEGGCAFVNKTWLEFTGRSFEESLNDGWADDVHPEDSRNVYEAYWRAFQARQAFDSEWRMRRYDGCYRWMFGRAAPRFRDDGTFAGFVGVVVDIQDAYGKCGNCAHGTTPRLTVSAPLAASPLPLRDSPAGPQVTVVPAVSEVDHQADR
jgi:PAS domain S-box-containing protein